MILKKIVIFIIIVVFISGYGLSLPKGCCKDKFQNNIIDIVRYYLKGQLNRNILEKMYGKKLKIIETDNENYPYIKYDVGCYKLQLIYSNPIARNNDVDLKNIYFFVKEEDRDGLPLAVLFELCRKEDAFIDGAKIPVAFFEYSEKNYPFKIDIFVKNIYISKNKNLKNSSARLFRLTRLKNPEKKI